MSDERHESPAHDAAARTVRELERPRPDAAFRARLRHEFVSGRIGRRRGLLPERPWFAQPWLLLPAAAALLAVALVFANRAPAWQVLAANGTGSVLVNGESVAVGDLAALTAHMRRGGHVQVAGELTLDVVAPGVLAVALAPGSDLELPPAPPRWWGRTMRAELNAGDVYFSTGPRFHGTTLDVTTPHATVRAVGTSFAVLCAPTSTCVCVMEGKVRVGGAATAAGGGREIPAGMRCVMHADQASETLPILDESVHHLHRQIAEAGKRLGR